MIEGLNVGDKVRVTTEFVVEGFYGGEYYGHGDGSRNYFAPDTTCAVEVIERAVPPDNGASDPVGTVRAETDDSAVYVKASDGRWYAVSQRGNPPNHPFEGNEMGHTKVVGAVPGTPADAAKADATALRARVAELMAQDKKILAIKEYRQAMANAGSPVSLREAKEAVEKIGAEQASPKLRVFRDRDGDSWFEIAPDRFLQRGSREEARRVSEEYPGVGVSLDAARDWYGPLYQVAG